MSQLGVEDRWACDAGNGGRWKVTAVVTEGGRDGYFLALLGLSGGRGVERWMWELSERVLEFSDGVCRY